MLRLRQIAFAASDLPQAEAALRDALGVELCYRDPNVGVFGLKNALFPVGDQFLEIVAPREDGTTAGRYLERFGAGGYMVILQSMAEIYPSLPLLNSDETEHMSAASLMSVRYFQAEPDSMPEEVFAEHHVLLNLCDTPHRVQNRRDGEMRDFAFHKHEIIVTLDP